MPIIIAIVAGALLIIGVGMYFFGPQPATNVPEETATTTPIEERRPQDTIDTSKLPPRPDTINMSTSTDTQPTSEIQSDPSLPTPPTNNTQTVSYLTPKRTSHEIDVTFTLANGVVTDASIVYDNKDGYSNDYQNRFDGLFKSEVIGKPLSGISLSRVGGASLTSEAFNEAVKKAAADTSA